jgi:hypothetical protein
MSSLKSGAAVAVGLVILLAGTARAQDAFAGSGSAAQAAIGGDQDWGTSTDIVYTAFAHEFNLFQGVEAAMNGTTAGRVCGTAPCGWLGTLHLPTGASIRAVELSACDGDAVQQVQFALFSTTKVPAGPVSIVPFQGTGTAATPGCSTFVFTLPTPVTVQNNTLGYILDVTENPGTNIQWNQFRVRYRLQVSAAPATATFPNDVPTSHPFFRFVEAMAASGLTGGCATGSFCPDTAVTRGQLSVFLSSALGLHFPN